MLRNITAYILFSSLFVAVCAVALCIETNILLRLPFNSISFYCFVFGATLAQYNFHYLLKTSATLHSERIVWSSKKRLLHKIFLTSGIILILYSFFNFQLHHFIILFLFAGIAFLYSFPVIIFGKKRRIKDFGFLKIITLSLMWTFVTVWFPVVNFAVNKNLFAYIFLQRFIFIFIICLLFDGRDIEIDRAEKINTIAVMIGKKNSYFLTYILVFYFIIISCLQFFYIKDKNVLIVMLLSSILTFITIEFSKKTNSDFFYLAAVDGMLLLQSALVYLMV